LNKDSEKRAEMLKRMSGTTNPMSKLESVKLISGENHYSKRPEHKDTHAGKNNGRYNPTIYDWENIKTGIKKSATRLEMITEDPSLNSGISSVIRGSRSHVKGWRIVK
jgi:hypothetical protein